MSHKIRTIFENLRGNWVFDKIIEDLNLQEVNTASGVASFSQLDPDNIDTLSFSESGKLLLKDDATPLNFTRKYIYKIVGNQIDIILDDGVTKGELFQTLIVEENEDVIMGSEHICKLDKHNGKYFFEDNSNFSTEYTVQGNKTNLRIKTTYRKINEENKTSHNA